MVFSILKQKRQYEGQREALSNQQFNMDQSNFALQSMKDNQVLFRVFIVANIDCTLGHCSSHEIWRKQYET
jgi:hypothetical protein